MFRGSSSFVPGYWRFFRRLFSLTFAFFFIANHSFAASPAKSQGEECHLSPKYPGYVSLAAPISSLLEELELLGDPLLKAVSVFHSLERETSDKNDFQLAGGIFLSPKTMERHKNAVIFFDESRELARSLKQNKVKAAVEISTRALNPFEANAVAVKALAPYLEGCGPRLQKLLAYEKLVQTKLKKMKFGNSPYIFFLGEIKKGQRPPELLIVNDGFVKYLKEELLMKTYPGELAYLSWSQKVLRSMRPFLAFGVVEGESKALKIEQVSQGEFNLRMKGILSPGLGQVRFLEAFADSKIVEQVK